MNKTHIVTILLSLLLIATLLHPDLQPYLFFFLLNGLVLINAGILYYNLLPDSGWTDRILGIFVLSFTQITVTQLYPGLLGYLSFNTVVISQVGCFGIILFCVRLGWLRIPSFRTVRHGLNDLWQAICEVAVGNRISNVACVVSLFAFMFVFWVSALNPPISLDGIMLHLVEAVKWMKSGQIPHQLEPGFPSPYGIGLLTTWLLYPFQHDFIARLSQTPVILMGGLAGYGICRQIGLGRTLSIVTALTVLTTPAYLANGITLTDPDTLMAGSFLISLYFALSLARCYRSGTVVLLALSMGLLLNSKYNALYYGVPLTCLVIYAWCKAWHESDRKNVVIFHGFLLAFIPILAGGASYLLYDYATRLPLPFESLMEGAPTDIRPDLVYNPFDRKFDILPFFLSPESLKETGLTALIGISAFYGFVKLAFMQRWRDMMLPAFLSFSVVFSLIIYSFFGIYPGSYAIPHHLATISLCTILAGWAMSQMKETHRRYGVMALAGLIAVSTILLFLRLWPVHHTSTSVLATGLALVVSVMSCYLLVAGKRDSMPVMVVRLVSSMPVFLFGIWLSVLGLHSWEFLYRDYKYARWPPFFGFGTAWTWTANATYGHGARIATNKNFYPLFGYDLKNNPVPSMPYVTRHDPSEERAKTLKAWELNLVQDKIDYVYLMAMDIENLDPISEQDRFEILDEWMTSRPDVYTLMFRGGRELVFRLNSSSHIMTDPTGATL